MNIHKKYLLPFKSDAVFNAWVSPASTVAPVTRVEVSHTGFTDQRSFVIHDAGWDSYIDGISKILSAK